MDKFMNASKMASDNEEIILGYIVNSDMDTVSVMVPKSKFSKPVIKLPQREKILHCDCYDKYELCAFKVVRDKNGSITSWKMTDCSKYVEVRKFVALLADKRILANDGKVYKIFDANKLHDDDGDNHIDYLISSNIAKGYSDVDLYIVDGLVYGTKGNVGSWFEDSWSIEDIMAEYLNSYSRFKVENIGKKVAEERANLPEL